MIHKGNKLKMKMTLNIEQLFYKHYLLDPNHCYFSEIETFQVD